MSRNKKIAIVLFSVVLLLGLVVAACVPGDVQQAIRDTRTDVSALKGDISKLSKRVDEIGKVVQDPEITTAERDIKEHVVRGRADFIGFQDSYNKFSKSTSSTLSKLVGTPAKTAKGVTTPAKPGIIQGIDGKLDRILGTPARKAVPAKEDPKTGKLIKAKPAVPAKPGLIDAVNEKLDKVVGIPAQTAVPEKTKVDKKTGKVTILQKAKPAVPAKPGAIDELAAQLKDIKDRLDKIEKTLPASATAPAKPAATAAAPSTAAPR